MNGQYLREFLHSADDRSNIANSIAAEIVIVIHGRVRLLQRRNGTEIAVKMFPQVVIHVLTVTIVETATFCM